MKVNSGYWQDEIGRVGRIRVDDTVGCKAVYVRVDLERRGSIIFVPDLLDIVALAKT